jgi:hypothetical protein
LNDEVHAFIVRGDAAGLERMLTDILPLYVRDARRVFVLDTTGRFVASAPAQPDLRGVDFGRTDYFLGAANPWRPFVSQIYLNEQTPEVTIAVPIFDAGGDPIGLLCAAVDLGRAATWLAAMTDLFHVSLPFDQRAA